MSSTCAKRFAPFARRQVAIDVKRWGVPRGNVQLETMEKVREMIARGAKSVRSRQQQQWALLCQLESELQRYCLGLQRYEETLMGRTPAPRP